MERALPRELLLQQSINGVDGLIQCFHCRGRGRVQPPKPGRPVEGHAQMVKEVFRKVDIDGDGVIDKDELTHCLTIVAGFNAEEVRELLRGFDRDGDMVINFEEFVDWIFLPGQKQREVRKKLTSALLPRVCWMYQEGHGSWAVFDRKMAMTLDEAYRDGVGAAVQVKGPAFSYIVDLDSMTQTNLKTGKERRVRRVGIGAEDGDEDLASMFMQPKAKWFCLLGRNRQRYDEHIENALEATLSSFEKGTLDSPELQMRVNGQAYVFDVDQMQQTNVKSGKSRRIRRDLAEPDAAAPDDDTLMRCPSNMQLPAGSCWVCRGSGRTSKWLEPIDDAEQYDGLGPDEGDAPDCLVCYADVAAYGISTTCDHVFCLECIKMSLEAIMDVGQFPAFCPMCRAESMGRDLEAGRIDGPSLTFLQQRGVITQAFQQRLLKQQGKALGIEEVDSFECPGRCGEFLLCEDASYAEGKVGQLFDDEASGNVCTRYGSCPACGTYTCVRCQASVAHSEDEPAPLHQCADMAHGDAAAPDEESLALMAKIGKKCPVCAQFIEKNEGCDMMICGTRAHGELAEVIRNNGCGIPFMWSNLAFCDDGWTDLDGSHKRGKPVTANQLKGRGHPKCARPECNLFKSVDDVGPELPWHNGQIGAQGKNNGGDYCCDKCRDDGTHNVLCHKIRWKP